MKRFLIAAVLLLLWSASGKATISKIQLTQNDNCLNTSTTCSVTVTSTTAGNAIVCFVNNLDTATTFTSCADGGDTFSTCSTSCHGQDTAGSTDMQYVLSGAGGKTTVTCTISASVLNNYTCGIFEFHTTTSGFSFDTSGNVDDSTSSVTQVGTALTLTGTSDVIVRTGMVLTSVSSIDSSYVLNVDGHGNGEAYLLNTSSGTAPTWTLTSAGSMAEGALALKESASSPKCSPSISLLGAGSCG